MHFQKETTQQKETYVVLPPPVQIQPCTLRLPKLVLKSSAYLAIPEESATKLQLETLLHDRCSSKKMNFFNRKMMYDPYYEKVYIRNAWMYKVPLLFALLEGISFDKIVDLRKPVTHMPARISIRKTFQLRDHQIKVHPLAMKWLNQAPYHATTICKACGAGKTIQASHIIGTLRVRTFIPVPTIDLAPQFKEELQVVMNLRESDIQLIGSDFPPPKPNAWIYICVYNSAMTTSCYETKYASILQSCDLLVVDECHMFPAKQVRSILCNFHGKYRLGLTATPERKDGLAHMIFKMLGPMCVQVEREKPPLGMWKMVTLQYYNPDHTQDIYRNSRYIQTLTRDSTKMMNRICEDSVRTQSIADFMLTHLTKDVLVLGDYKSIVHDLAKRLEAKRPGSTFVYVGQSSKSKKAMQRKKEAFASSPFIIATTAKAGQAMNIKRLNTVVFITPRNPDRMLIQGAGRVLRRKDQKFAYYVEDTATEYYLKKSRLCTQWFLKTGYQIMPTKLLGPNCIPGSIQACLQKRKRNNQNGQTEINEINESATLPKVFKRRRTDTPTHRRQTLK